MPHEIMRAANATLNADEYGAGRTILESWPRVLFMELTRKCNAACWMCRPFGGNRALPQMSMETFRRIADQTFPRADVVDLRGWGESLIHPEFVPMLEYAASLGPRLKIYTNLSVGRRRCEALVEYDVTTAVSFDAAEKKLFETLRRGCRFELVRENLAFLAAAAQAKGRPGLLYLSVTVQGGNLPQVPKIVALAGELGISEVKLFPLICEESDPAHLSHHLDAVVSMLDEATELALASGVRLSLGASMDETLTSEHHALTAPCLHPWAYCYVDPSGRLGFCDHLIGQAAFILAEDSENFHSAWNSEGFQRLRSQHACGPQALEDDFHPCRWCYGRRYMDTENWIDRSVASREVSSCTVGRLHHIGRFNGSRRPFVSGWTR